MKTDYLDYTDGKHTFEGFVAHDEAKTGKSPCVIIYHAWGGQADFDRQIAEKLAEWGYVGFAADVYGKGIRGEAGADNTKLIQPLLDDRAGLRDRLLCAVESAKSLPFVESTKVAAIGFCFGGLCALDLARAAVDDVKGVISFHGLFFPPNLGEQKKIEAKILILHGWEDPLATPEHVTRISEELTHADADWQLHAYGKTKHAFTLPSANDISAGNIYNAQASKRAWQAAQNFLTEIFS